MDIKKKLKKIPKSPGVYLMKDGSGKIIYIGKAKDLLKRVSSYFQKSRAMNSRHMLLMDNLKTIDHIVTSSEEEALILEASLVRANKPKYNVELKDDKSFPFLKLTVHEAFPRLEITREKIKDGSKYFGPYIKVKLLKQALSIMKSIFPLRQCKRIPKNVCLFYHIGQCYGPCVGAIDKKRYNKIVRQASLFLEGKKARLLRELSKDMARLSKKRCFEEAITIRNRISALSEVPGKTMREYSSWGDVAIKLKRLLHLPRLPYRIEAFDVSNIMGTGSAGSMVCFFKGVPHKSDYRRFKIKDVGSIDDYAMMKEIVRRRYKRLKEEKKNFPDLIIIDGGKGHLRTAYSELISMNLTKIPIISIAKKEELIYTVGSTIPIDINRDSKLLYFIQCVRDEAHRFALKYHHDLRNKKLFC